MLFLKKISNVAFITSAVAMTSCGSMSDKKQELITSSDSSKSGLGGCVHGSVINGLTGNPIEVNSFDGQNGLSVLVRDQLVGAGVVGGSNSKEMVMGQYAICGVPTDEDYTLFAQLPGYQSFMGTVHIDSTVTPKGAQIKEHLFKASPALEANVVLYPIGTRTQDLVFSVIYSGAPVKGASVELRPTGRNALDTASATDGETHGFDSRVLAPRDVRLKTLTASTDESGNAVFSKDDLVLGGVYKYVVLPPDTLISASTEIDTVGSVVVGLQTSGSGRNPYRYSAILKPMAAELAILQTSVQSQSTSPDGSVSMVFNRPIELITPADAIYATLSNAVDAELMPEISANRTSDTLSISLSNDGTVIKLTPKFKVQPNSAREPALSITYSAFQVRPASAPLNIKTLAVPSLSTKLFGLDSNPTLVAQKISKSGASDNQKAVVSTLLPEAIGVTVLDQFGLGLKNQTVTFMIQTGSGSIKKINDTTFQSSITVTTDSNGFASVQWALGSSVGEQTLSAKVGSLETIIFKATATN